MLVSCVCPTYGRAPDWLHLLEEAIESFLRQDWSDKELIVLNDARQQSLVCDAPGVHILNQSWRFGTLGAKYNAAIEYSRGELICPWEDDDISLPWRISKSIEALGAADYYNPYAEWFMTAGALHNGGGVCHHASIFRRTAWERVGGYPLMSGAQDQGMNTALHRDCITSNAAPPCKCDRWYIYRWGVSPCHLSGSGTHQEFWDQVGQAELQAGTWELKPHWQKDYVAICRKKIHAIESGRDQRDGADG